MNSVAYDIAVECITENVESDYWVFNDHEFEKFINELVQECCSVVSHAVDMREPASTYVWKIKQHFAINN